MKQLIRQVGCLCSVLTIVISLVLTFAPEANAVIQYNIHASASLIYDSSQKTVISKGTYLYTGHVFDMDDGDYYLEAGYCSGSKNIDGLDACPTFSYGTSNFYIVYGYRNNSGDHWVNYGTKTPIHKGDIFISSLITDGSGTDFIGWVDRVMPLATIYKTGVSSIYSWLYVYVSVEMIRSTCSISTSHNMAFNWPALTLSELNNGSAEVKKAPVIMDCSGSTGTSPVAVTITSTNGSYDANNGVVKTNKDNLGIQLTWAENDTPVAMDKVTNFPATPAYSKDFSINAKPIQLGSGDVSGGDFDTKVTMSLEYK